MTAEEIYAAGVREIPLFQEGRQAAHQRLCVARNLCHAVAGQDPAIQAEATSDLEDAVAVGSEWGVIQQSRGL